VFILLADAITPDRPISMTVVEAGRSTVATFSMPKVHGATMITFLAAPAGLFMILDARVADRRLALMGLRVPALLASRLDARR
jgi:hypothetical protein